MRGITTVFPLIDLNGSPLLSCSLQQGGKNCITRRDAGHDVTRATITTEGWPFVTHTKEGIFYDPSRIYRPFSVP
jgi:hypothetical protein